MVDVNPTVYDGPATSKLNFNIPALAPGTHTVTLRAPLKNGILFTRSWPLVVDATGATVGSATAAAAAPAAVNLAFTGSSVNLPLAAGFGLIGAGGLTVLAARKRQRRS